LILQLYPAKDYNSGFEKNLPINRRDKAAAIKIGIRNRQIKVSVEVKHRIIINNRF
jgi:hypothetical protein